MENKQDKRKGKSWLGFAIVWILSVLLAFWIGRQMVISEDYTMAATNAYFSLKNPYNVIVISDLGKDAFKIATKRLSKEEKVNIVSIYDASLWYQQLARDFALEQSWAGRPVGTNTVRNIENYVENVALISIRYKDEDWEVSMLNMFDPEKDPVLDAYFRKQPFQRK